MASGHTHHDPPYPDSIPLQPRRAQRSSHDEESGSDFEPDYLPDSDAAFLRRHRDPSEDEDEDEHTSVSTFQSVTVLGRLASFIMSRAPLLIRSAPTLGTSSYGAVPGQGGRQGSLSNSDDNEVDAVGRRDKQKHKQQTQSASGLRERGAAGSERLQRVLSARGRRRRSSSNASEIGMGLESKTSFASGGSLPGRGRLESVEASTRSHSGNSTEQTATDDEHDETDNDHSPDNSPYPEVRASVPATDNTTFSISTPRMWTLSLLFALVGSATNLFFSLRYPSVAITPVIALVLVHPLGRLWDLTLKRDNDPPETFINGVRHNEEDCSGHRDTRSRLRLWLAQGQWNEKEHACVYVSSNISFGFAFATDVIVEQHKFYNQDVPMLYQILLTISTQILGYAFAGLTRRFLVRPAAMIWPGTLMSTAMFTTMHKQENKPANGWTISRYKFFVLVWGGAFAWYFIPGLLMPALSYFSVVTWIAPKSVVVANLVSLL